MNRRSFFPAAAASTAAVLEISASANAQIMNAPKQTGSSPAIQKPIEMDLADPKAEAYWQDSGVDLFVRLEELYPCDPGELSPASLRMSSASKFVGLNAQIGDTLQPWGYRSGHCLGYLEASELAYFADEAGAGANCMMKLREQYPYIRPDAFSGVSLVSFGASEAHEAQVHLYFGGHCLGVLRGQLLTTFLHCARIRSAEATQA